MLTATLLVIGAVALAQEPWGYARGVGEPVPLADYDETGAAVLTDAKLPPTVEEIVFVPPVGGSLSVGTLALTNRTLRFGTTAGRVTLRAAREASLFLLGGGAWTFDGLSFEGKGAPSTKAQYNGGAIDCLGGEGLSVTNCVFSRFGTRFSGGAISARLMTGDMTIASCSFANNQCGSLNGSGGAIYASCVRGGEDVLLTLADCRFDGNLAQNGGAVSTVCTAYDEEAPVNLFILTSTFANNTAEYAGGAIHADGNCVISETIFENNMAGLQGGALNMGASREIPAACLLQAGTEFIGNSVFSLMEWTCGGAISVWGDDSVLAVDGRFVVFRENKAESRTKTSYGGAIFASEGADIYLSRSDFSLNQAQTAGGAIYVCGGEAVVYTSIFSNDTVTAASDSYGGAIVTDHGSLVTTNVTIRFANRGAVNALSTKVQLVNTVIADNNGEADIEVTGENASLEMHYVAYGRIVASEEVQATIVTNACIPGADASIFVDQTLFLTSSEENPVAVDGMTQDDSDYRNVEYGWKGDDQSSIGAYECSPVDTPSYEIVKCIWYHNRADGLYYPQVTLRHVSGDPQYLDSLYIVCNGERHALPEACLAELRAATRVGQLYVFGMDDEHWVASAGSQENFGYIIPKGDMTTVKLFSCYDAARLDVAVVTLVHPLQLRVIPIELPDPEAPPKVTAAMQSVTAPVVAQFADFAVGETLTGRAETLSDAEVMLFGCAALGEDWQFVRFLDLDGEGRFSVPVPEELRFFKLEAEIER